MRSAREMNIAFMMKAGWALCANHAALWVWVVRNKYKYGDEALPHVIEDRTSSYLWRGICCVWGHINEHVVWRLVQVPLLISSTTRGFHPLAPCWIIPMELSPTTFSASVWVI